MIHLEVCLLLLCRKSLHRVHVLVRGFAADAVVVVLSRLKVARSLGGHCLVGRVGGLGPSCHLERNPALLVLTVALVPKSARMPWTGCSDKEVLGCGRFAYSDSSSRPFYST